MPETIYCHDERHDTPCPLPCEACGDECEPTDDIDTCPCHECQESRHVAEGQTA